MKWFRHSLQKNRIFVLTLLSICMFGMMDMRNYVYAYQEWEAKEKRLQEISEFLDVPIDQLRPDHETVYDRVKDLFGIVEEDPVKVAGMKRLQEVLRKHEEQLAANPYLPQIEKVKREHAPSRIEGLLRDVLQLTQPRHGKALPQGSQRALLRGLHYGMKDGLEESLALPIDENLPAKAQRKHAEFQAKLNQVMGNVKSVVDETQSDAMKGTLPQKVAQLSLKDATGLERKTRRSRYVDRGLPNQRVEKKAAKRAVQGDELTFTPQPVTPSKPAGSLKTKSLQKSEIHQEILDLAESLDHTPSLIFSWVHDTIEVDPKWGATKSPVGTLREKLGTSWDQAWLLQELLIASGVDARLEWGEVQIELDQLRDLTGVEDAWRAGDMMTTAGTPFVLLTQGNQPVAARMDHVWVKAHLDYVPRRAALPHGTGDTWVRLDPTIKQYHETEGIQLYDKVPFTLESYLLSGTTESPRRVYEDAMWQYIRDNNIQCATLEQVKRARSIQTESFPFVPGSLRAKVVSVDGEAATTPDAYQYQIAFDVRDLTGRSLLQWSSPWPAVYGKRIELAWPGATAEDQATLDAEGGVFETAPYLVDLKPSLRLDGLTAIDGQSVGSADDIEIYGNLTPPEGQATNVLFQGQAGERNVFAVDLGTTPQQRLDELQAALNDATEASNDAEAEANTLALIGATYMSILSRDLEDLAEWKWQRVLELGTFGTVIQSGDVQTTIGGSPLSFGKGPLVTDVATMPLGTFPADAAGNQGQGYGVETFELVGSQSSFLEGTALDMIVPDETMTAVTFLTRAARNGQQLQKVDSGNVESVLAAVDIGEAVEQEVREAVGQGKIAWVAESELQINQWRGSGYIIEDPSTGAAGYLGTGGYGVGAATGRDLSRRLRTLGDESWLSATDGIFAWLFEFLGLSSTDLSSIFGDPVNLTNGNLWRTETDLSVMARGLPILWSRTYNSQSDFNGPLGLGWTFFYGEQVLLRSDGSAIYQESDGTEHLFELLSSGLFKRPAGKQLDLSSDGSGYSLKDNDGTIKRFDNSGRMESMADRHGNTVSISYDSAGSLAGITDATGREVLTIGSLNGKIVSVTDLAGRSIEYTYLEDRLSTFRDAVGELWTYQYDDGGKLVAVTNPLLYTDYFSYDAEGRATVHIDRSGERETVHYSETEAQAVIVDKRGFLRSVEFDERGRPLRGVDPFGNTFQAVWDEDNNWTEKMDPRGNKILRSYDSRGNVLIERDSAGHLEEMTYEAEFNQLKTYTNAEESTVTYNYDANKNLSTVSREVDGKVIVDSFTYDSLGQLVEAKDAEGREYTLTYGSNGVVETQTNGIGDSTTFISNEIGLLEEVEDPEKNRMTAEYNDRMQPVMVKGWFGNQVDFQYDEVGQLSEVSGSIGFRKWFHDPVGRQTSSIDPLGHKTQYEYDADGNRIAAIDGKGNRTSFVFDAVGRRLGVVDALGNTWSWGYCNEIGVASQCGGGSSCGPYTSNAAFCHLTDPKGNTFTRELDARGFVTSIVDPEGNTTLFEYDRLGRKTATVDALQKRTELKYNEADLLTSVLEPNGAVTIFEYDGSGNQILMKNAEGHIWRQSFDELDRLKTKSDPLDNTIEYRYDSLGNSTGWTDANGQDVEYVYDVNRLVKIVGQGGSIAEFTHWPDGKIKTAFNEEVHLDYAYDSLGRPIQVDNSTLAESMGYRYDPAGNISKRIRSEGEVQYSYNARNELVEIEDPVLGSFEFEYDSVGRRTRMTHPNNLVTTYSYDRASRLESVLVRDSNEDIVDGFSYAYDSVGKRLSSKNLKTLSVREYKYDEVGRLVRWEDDSGEFEEFSYDLVGNRLSKLSPGRQVAYSYDEANRLKEMVVAATDDPEASIDSVSYDWDDNGNLIKKDIDEHDIVFRYDSLNRLTEVIDGTEDSISMGYGPNGERVRRSQGSEDTRFLVDFVSEQRLPQVIASFGSNGERNDYFVFGPRIDEPLGVSDASGAKYLHHDGLGSISALSSDGGDVVGSLSYSPFGTAVEGASSSRFTFTGREQDTENLMYYRARYYEPETGRFLSRDMWEGSQENPVSIHKYAYAMNDPINMTDPSGNTPLNKVVGLFFFGLGISSMATFFTAIYPDIKPWFGIEKQVEHTNSGVWLVDTIRFLFSLGITFALGYLNYLNFMIARHLFFKSKRLSKIPFSWKAYKRATKRFANVQLYEYALSFAACGGVVWALLDPKITVPGFAVKLAGGFGVCMGASSLVFG